MGVSSRYRRDLVEFQVRCVCDVADEHVVGRKLDWLREALALGLHGGEFEQVTALGWDPRSITPLQLRTVVAASLSRDHATELEDRRGWTRGETTKMHPAVRAVLSAHPADRAWFFEAFDQVGVTAVSPNEQDRRMPPRRLFEWLENHGLDHAAVCESWPWWTASSWACVDTLTNAERSDLAELKTG